MRGSNSLRGRHVLIARNETRQYTMMEQGRVADRPCSRIRGLIGTEELSPGEGLWILPCNGIHMLFMSFPIDAVYLDRDHIVVETVEEMQPWSIGRFVRGAQSVLELPSGTIAASGTRVGDRIALECRSTP